MKIEALKVELCEKSDVPDFETRHPPSQYANILEHLYRAAAEEKVVCVSLEDGESLNVGSLRDALNRENRKRHLNYSLFVRTAPERLYLWLDTPQRGWRASEDYKKRFQPELIQ